MITKIWYSVENYGDGSAYPKFMENKKLCEIDQQYANESWGESCVGYLEIESDSPIKVAKLITTNDVIQETEKDLNQDYMKKYKQQGKYPEWIARLESKLISLKRLLKRQEKIE